jgi:hypothetical protein
VKKLTNRTYRGFTILRRRENDRHLSVQVSGHTLRTEPTIRDAERLIDGLYRDRNAGRLPQSFALLVAEAEGIEKAKEVNQ